MTCVNIRLFVLCIQNTYLEKLYLGNNLETFYICGNIVQCFIQFNLLLKTSI